MVRSNDHRNTSTTVDMMLVRRLTIVMLCIGAVLITYAIGQWIDGDNLFMQQTLHPFWQFQIRTCPAC